MQALNILITAASRRVPLVRAFQRALQAAGVRGRIVVTDVNPLSPAVHVAERAYDVPLSSAPEYIETIAAICAVEHVSLIVPTIDDELESFGKAAGWLRSCGVRVAVSPEATSRTCVDKLATCNVLRSHGVAAAETMLPADVPSSPRFPLFIKPRFGRGGVGAFPIRNTNELAFFTGYVENAVIQEFLDGPEFTIDMLCDFRHRPLAVVPRERVVVRAGVIDRGRTVRDQSLIDLARSVADVLPFTGAVNVQCRVVNGTPTVFEINPRFSGGIPLTIAAGADFPRILIELALGRRVDPRLGEFRGELWMTNFETSVFLEPSDLTIRRHPPMLMGDVA